MKKLDVLMAILVIVGGLNWGLVGLFNFNLVEFLIGTLPALERFVYIVVGFAALYQIFQFKSIQARWK
ncbi:DUF378 domain-containing protein [Chlamydiales bacterium]|nr:DUF378 domain-containing protein [Chlamydiales bacterium]